MFAKLSLRNLPQEIFNALEALATRHDRSTEAEARQAIRAWVEPTIVQGERNARRQEVAERLTRLLEQVNYDMRTNKLRPSHVAQRIGESTAEGVEDWFLGLKEPTFTQLQNIADLFGVRAEWLQHGDGAIYPVQLHRLSEDPATAVNWLTKWDTEEHEGGDQLKTLHLIRSTSDQGELYVVKASTGGRYRIFYTPTHVSEHIGAGGEAMLRSLFVTLELLYKRYTAIGAPYSVKSHLVKPADITNLTNGNTNPSAILLDRTDSMWWEDCWDAEMFKSHEYWPGWRALSERIDRVIGLDKHLASIRDQIRKGEVR